MGRSTPGIWIVALVLFAAAFGTGMIVTMAPGSLWGNPLLGKWEPAGVIPTTIEFTSESVITTVPGRPVDNYRVRYETVSSKYGDKTHEEVLVIPLDATAGHKTMRATILGSDALAYRVDGESHGILCSRVK